MVYIFKTTYKNYYGMYRQAFMVKEVSSGPFEFRKFKDLSGRTFLYDQPANKLILCQPSGENLIFDVQHFELADRYYDRLESDIKEEMRLEKCKL